MRSLRGCLTELKPFLEDPAIKKTGVNITADSTKLKNDHAVDLQGAVEFPFKARAQLPCGARCTGVNMPQESFTQAACHTW